MRLRATLTMATPILGQHLPTLRSLVEFGCCIREGDAGIATADRILPVGEQFVGDGARQGTGSLGIVAGIARENMNLDPTTLGSTLGKSNRKTVAGRRLVVENILNSYSWHFYPTIVAEGEGDPVQVARVLRRIDSIGLRRNVGWGWISEVEVSHV